jgi:hypothetical protein
VRHRWTFYALWVASALAAALAALAWFEIYYDLVDRIAILLSSPALLSSNILSAAIAM